LIQITKGCASGAAILVLVTTGAAQLRQTNLVSDGFLPAIQTDPRLVNPWGLAFSPTGPLWVADNGAAVSTVYQNDGTIEPLVVGIPPVGSSTPTGIVFNGGTGFKITANGATAPAAFIFVTEDGSVSGWSPKVNALQSVQVVAHGPGVSIYKGAALATKDDRQYLYATDFHQGKVDIFDDTFTFVKSFTDTALPSNYAPFNVMSADGRLYVTFAETDANREDDVDGTGKGFVDVFTLSGRLIRRLAGRGELNAPWGMAIAPRHWGRFSNCLLVGNFGNGQINVFDRFSGRRRGKLTYNDGNNININGLWALAFRDIPKTHDNDGDGDPDDMAHALFFTAGSGHEQHGLLGMLTRGGVLP